MEMYSGKYKVIDTGSVVAFDETSGIEMVIKPNSAFKFSVFIDFEESDGDRGITKDVDEKSGVIKIRCLNFNQGAGTVEPLELATSAGKKVSLHLWVEKVSENNFIRKIDYTVFIER